MNKKAYITASSVLTPIGNSIEEIVASFEANAKGHRDLTVFNLHDSISFPVCEVGISDKVKDSKLPRTHIFALELLERIKIEKDFTPDAIILGTTTGGILSTEEYLKDKSQNSHESVFFPYHGAGTVAELLAAETGCTGPLITISTACSSGTACFKIALEMIRKGEAQQVLVGAIDSICRLTFHGFNSLQLISHTSSKPFDKNRDGMSLGEGGALFLVESEWDNDAVEVSGAGISCDAYHGAAPDPSGNGARASMNSALHDAGMMPDAIDYINLHGTGTLDNDISEAKAIKNVFLNKIPEISSIKGATGHSLAASGAIEAFISLHSITSGFLPPNTGWDTFDKEIGLQPAIKYKKQPVNCVLSNSFGFGGNNASVVLCKKNALNRTNNLQSESLSYLNVRGFSLISGQGNLEETILALSTGHKCTGQVDNEYFKQGLEKRKIRRLKRLPLMALSLAEAALNYNDEEDSFSSVFLGTAWGPLSETMAFYTKLFKSDEEFGSAIDFIGSVHNSPAAQIAIAHEAQEENITTTGGYSSFYQALYTSSLLKTNSSKILLMGADEMQSDLSPIIDLALDPSENNTDGGAAFLIEANSNPKDVSLFPLLYRENVNLNQINVILKQVCSHEMIKNYNTLWIGLHLDELEQTKILIEAFFQSLDFIGQIVYYCEFLGNHSSSPSIATALATHQAMKRTITIGNKEYKLEPEKGSLVIDIEKYISVIEIKNWN